MSENQQAEILMREWNDPNCPAAVMERSLATINRLSDNLIENHGYKDVNLYVGSKGRRKDGEYTVVRALHVPFDFAGDHRIRAKLFAVSVIGKLLVGWGYWDGTGQLRDYVEVEPGICPA